MIKKKQNLNLKPIPPIHHSVPCREQGEYTSSQASALPTSLSSPGLIRHTQILCQFILKSIHECYLWKTTGKGWQNGHATTPSCILLCTDRFVAMDINYILIEKNSKDTPKPSPEQLLDKNALKPKARLTGRYWTTVPFCFPTASCFPLGLQHTG